MLETVGVEANLFSSIDRTYKLYLKKNMLARFPIVPVISGEGRTTSEHKQENTSMNNETDYREKDAQQAADQVLLAHYVPASVVIDADMEIVQFRGHISPYLEPASGKASFNLLRMARPELGWGLRAAIHAAAKSGAVATRTGLQVTSGDSVKEVTVEVHPLKARSGLPTYLVIFTDTARHFSTQEAGPSRESETASITPKRDLKDRQVTLLEQELVATRTEMQALLEEREAINEELQIANEEIRSSNEELQTINEELETSQEEIQSSNEELGRVNQQLSLHNVHLQAARDYADAIVETVREPLLILDAQIHIVRANAAFYRYFQTVPGEVEHRSLYELGSGEWDNTRLHTLLEEMLPRNQSFQNIEIDATFPSIGHKTMLLNARRLALEGMAAPLILLAMEDITERKRLDRQKDAFLGTVSHELKTPITGIGLYAQVLERRFRTKGDEQSAGLLGKMSAQLGTLTHLINVALDVTALEAGKLQLQRSVFAIDDLVRDVVEEVQRTSETHQLQIEGQAQQQVYADRARVEQVLTNLLSNAIKYSSQAKLVQIRATANEEYVVVSVQDFGMGIPREQQAHVFERYFRVGAAEQETISGLGLGLYISSEIMKEQGGQIQVESRVGGGSTFSFTLPMQKHA